MAKDEKKPVFDVAKPGSTPPDTSAKPVIVSHKPMIKDPMVNEDKVSDEPEKTPEEIKTVSKSKVIEPLASEDKPTEVTEASKEDPEPEEDKSEKPEEEATEEAAVVDAVVSQAEDKKKKTKDAEEDAAKRANIEKLIETKKYFVKVKPAKAKRDKRTLVVVVIIALLSLVGVGVAADAGIIPLNVPFNFIKNSDDEPSVVTTPQQDEDKTPQPNPSDSQKTKTESEKNTFVSEELGLSFEHSSTIEPSVTKTGEEFTKAGTAYMVSLGAKLLGYAYTADWKPAEGVTSVNTYTDCVSSDETTKVTTTFSSGTDYCIKAYDYIDTSTEPAGAPAAVIVMQKKLDTLKGIVLIEISSQPIGNSTNANFTEQELKEQFKTVASELEIIAKTAKSTEANN